MASSGSRGRARRAPALPLFLVKKSQKVEEPGTKEPQPPYLAQGLDPQCSILAQDKENHGAGMAPARMAI